MGRNPRQQKVKSCKTCRELGNVLDLARWGQVFLLLIKSSKEYIKFYGQNLDFPSNPEVDPKTEEFKHWLNTRTAQPTDLWRALKTGFSDTSLLLSLMFSTGFSIVLSVFMDGNQHYSICEPL